MKKGERKGRTVTGEMSPETKRLTGWDSGSNITQVSRDWLRVSSTCRDSNSFRVPFRDCQYCSRVKLLNVSSAFLLLSCTYSHSNAFGEEEEKLIETKEMNWEKEGNRNKRKVFLWANNTFRIFVTFIQWIEWKQWNQGQDQHQHQFQSRTKN